MSKFTVAFAAAAKPLRLAAEAAGKAYCFGGKAAPIAPVLWEGWTLSAYLVRHARTVCGVPAPYHALAIWYRAEHPVLGKFESKPASELARLVERALRKAAAA